MADKVEGRSVCKITKIVSDKTIADNVNKDIDALLNDKDMSKEGFEIKIKKEVKPGDDYITITDVEKASVKDGESDSNAKVSIEHTKGEVLLIDFWATWCPPCQAPMQHNQKMLEENEGWKDKGIRIIGLSIDQDKSKLLDHVKSKKWVDVEHFFRSGSKASEVYSVSGVPHVMLIDTNGKIAFKGHPAHRPNLKEDLENLKAGKELTGEGTASAAQGGGGDEGESNEGFVEGEMDKYVKEIKEFSKVGEELQKDEKIKAHKEKMMRAFCVMVLQSKYVPNSGKSTCKFENYRVLVGGQEAITEIKAILAEKVKGSFQVVEREQAIPV